MTSPSYLTLLFWFQMLLLRLYYRQPDVVKKFWGIRIEKSEPDEMEKSSICPSHFQSIRNTRPHRAPVLPRRDYEITMYTYMGLPSLIEGVLFG